MMDQIMKTGSYDLVVNSAQKRSKWCGGGVGRGVASLDIVTLYFNVDPLPHKCVKVFLSKFVVWLCYFVFCLVL